ncbi:MAG: YfhO family protein, partial [Planctomycetes bacterium]|nr:YfhO family protein [Planctomycetota bacterium]
ESPDAPARAIAFVRDDPTRVELDVAAGAAPWLVLTDTFLPGWTATVDGASVPIVRVDHAFRGIALPANACRVAFTYTAPGLGAGLGLAAFATVALAVWWFAARRCVDPAAAGD